MKKDYMKPAGNIVSIRVNENIATSDVGDSSDLFGIHYTYGEDGVTRYIFGSEHAASSTGDEGFDRFRDLVNTYVYGLSACRYDPDEPAE